MVRYYRPSRFCCWDFERLCQYSFFFFIDCLINWLIVRWIKRCIIKSYDPCRSGSMDCAFELAYYEIWFDKKILEDPNTFSSSSSQITKNLEFGQKEWLLRLESLQTFDESDVRTKRQKKREKGSSILPSQVSFLQCFSPSLPSPPLCDTFTTIMIV